MSEQIRLEIIIRKYPQNTQEKDSKPNDGLKYRMAIQLYKIYNRSIVNEDWLDMNHQQNIPLDWLNLTIETYEVKYKKLLL